MQSKKIRNLIRFYHKKRSLSKKISSRKFQCHAIFIQGVWDNWARNARNCSVEITVTRMSYCRTLSSRRKRSWRMGPSSLPISSISRTCRKSSWIIESTGSSTSALYLALSVNKTCR